MYIGEDYKKFLSAGNRRDFIIEWLYARGVKAVVMPIDGHEHIYVVFSKEAYNPLLKIKTVIAHYDIFPGSPGANDNSSSVFALMNWAIRLKNSSFCHNVRLIFTDGEEISSGGRDCSVATQGAFGLANVFKRLNITDDDVYVFDCMGRGSVPVIAKTFLSKKINGKLQKAFLALQSRIESVLRISNNGNYVTLPVSYSDNAGFLANGIPAVAVTMLPLDECNKYMYDLMHFPLLEDYVLNNKIQSESDKVILEKMLPETWKKLHTNNDNIESLDEESFVIMERILDNLAKLNAL